MDAPTPSLSPPKIAAGASVEVPLKAVFNAEVFKLTVEFKPMTVEAIANRRSGGRSVERRCAVTFPLGRRSGG